MQEAAVIRLSNFGGKRISWTMLLDLRMLRLSLEGLGAFGNELVTVETVSTNAKSTQLSLDT